MADSTEKSITPENTSDTSLATATITNIHTETVEVPEGYALRLYSPEELEHLNMMLKFFGTTQNLIGATPTISNYLFAFFSDKKDDGTMQGNKIKEIIAKSLDGIPFVNEKHFGVFSIRGLVDNFVLGYLEPIISGKMSAIEFLLSKQGEAEPDIQRDILVWKKNMHNVFTDKVIAFFGAKLPKQNTALLEPNNQTIQ
jgi:hypothetical protein